MTLNNTYFIYGMGKSGTATANAILNAGGTVFIGDDKPIADDYIPQAKRINIFDNTPLPSDITAIITTPGLPFTHPKPHRIYELATENHIAVMCDIELFYRIYGNNPNAKFIAITGTNGKSTVTALTTHLLKHAGFNAYMGGNIGTAMFELPAPADKHIIYVLEISSYQADLCFNFMPDSVGFLNLTPDHIDRHGSIQGYFNSKMRLFSHLKTHGKAYISGHELGGLGEFETQALDIANSHNALITLTQTQMMQIKADIAINPYLCGHHNYLNALTACALSFSVGCDDFSGLKNYIGLPHRSEFIRTKNNITFVNDSKATNAEATRPALHAYKNIFWLAGGVPKAEGIDPLFEKDMVNITYAFFYGQAGQAFYDAATNHNIPCSLFDTLENALNAAYTMAQNDTQNTKTILLSPCCASFDAFDNFEHRGVVFKELCFKV